MAICSPIWLAQIESSIVQICIYNWDGASWTVVVWRQDRLSLGDLCSGLMIENGCPEVKL